MSSILTLHGPNLNLLGQREPETYGKTTLAEINTTLTARATEWGHTLTTFQSNAEHELIDAIQQAAQQNIALILFNPAAFTHSSIALRDTLLATNMTFIEIHLSNPKQRETFRHHSFFSDIALGTIGGFGAQSYYLALQAAHDYLLQQK